MSFIVLGCGSDAVVPGTKRFAAQCLGVDASGGLAKDYPLVCWLDGDGQIASVSDMELSRGLPFVVDEVSNRVLAISRTGNVIDVTDEPAKVVGSADARSAYGFTGGSVLVRLSDAGEVRTADGEFVLAFAVDGVVDVSSGIDINGDRIAFTLERPSGNWAIVVGDMSTGEVSEVFVWTEYVGGVRWSPDGTRLSFTGPDYRSIVVTTADGAILAIPASDDTRLSGRVVGPRWIDNDTIIYHDSATALLVASVSTDSAGILAVHPIDAERDFVPVLPVPLPGLTLSDDSA